MKKAVIISISSDIGTAVALDLLEQGARVVGTYRTSSSKTRILEEKGAELIQCDFADKESVQLAAEKIMQTDGAWDSLIVCPATQEPFGSFSEVDFTEWRKSIDVNFTNQMQILQSLLPSRNTQGALGPLVLFFAGGGPNKATRKLFGLFCFKGRSD